MLQAHGVPDPGARRGAEARQATVAGDLEGAAERWRAALALWRGPALAGLPNFAGTSFGVITRLSANPQPPADSLYGISIEGLRCDAVALAFDLARWRAHFVAQWPPDSAAYDRCYTRITDGIPLRLEQGVRGAVTQTAH